MFPDELSWRKALERLQASGMVVGIDKEVEMSAQLLVIVIVVAFNSSFLDCAVHALDLSIRPRVVGLCQAMLDLIGFADWSCCGLVPLL